MEKKETKVQNLESVKSKKHVVVEAKGKNIAKLDSFCRVMQEVADDMGLKAYVDDTSYLIGADY